MEEGRGQIFLFLLRVESTDSSLGHFCVVVHFAQLLRSFWSLGCDRQMDSDQGREPKKST